MTYIKNTLIALFFTLSLNISLVADVLHKYYVGVTEINYNKEAKTVEIAVKLFTDDLERALEESGEKERLFLGEKNENEATNEAIIAYLTQNFVVEINGKEYSWNFIGKEADIEACWSFLEIKNVKRINELKVINNALLEILPKQTHLVHININNNKQSALLNISKNEELFNFK